MATARSDEDVEGLDEEFLFHLSRGAELLGKADADGARAALERALALRPRDSKALGLLGQAQYRLGNFDEAATAYGRLVNENPVEAAARVNLGLANLKAKRYADAVKQLEIALDLSPGHKKAMGYLGLAHLEIGDFGRARGWFVEAGSEQMVTRCDELIALARPPAAEPAAGAPGELASDLEPAPTPFPSGPQDPGFDGAPGELAQAEAPFDSPPIEPVFADASAEAPATAPPPMLEAPIHPKSGAAPDAAGAQAATLVPPVLSLTALVAERLVVPEAVEVFAVSADLLTVAVRGEVLVRGRGLAVVRGAVRLSPEVKRFRGKATDRPFGEGEDRMVRATGEGALLYRAGERRLVAVELGGESGYFREEAVFAFEGRLGFDNGRVASPYGTDLSLVHLRGRGRLLLALSGDPVAVAASADAALRLPLAAVVGWIGQLTPRLAPLFEGGDPIDPGEQLCVELSGDGRALVDPEAVPGAASHA